MFISLRTRSYFQNILGADEFKVCSLSEVIQINNTINNDINYDLCIVWINVFLEFPKLDNGLLLESSAANDDENMILDFCTYINSICAKIANKLIWINQDQFWRLSRFLFPYQLVQNSLIHIIGSKIKKSLPANITVVDINDIIATIGIKSAYENHNFWRWGNPYSFSLEQKVAEQIHKIYQGGNLKPIKCIILDCDNVLWDGILSEIGVNNIKVCNYGIGLKYYLFQKIIVAYLNMGIIICLCSKNDKADVENVFKNHSGMLLKWESIAYAEISWENKDKGIAKILDDLNIDAHEVLFIDDSIEEINMAKYCFPEIYTLRFDKDNIYEICHLINLDSGNIFLHSMDKRQLTYLTNKKRTQLRNEAITYEDYLKKLNTKINIKKAESIDIQRIAELSQRTNKCNIGYKYSENEIARKIKLSGYMLYVIEASDAFSDLGIVGCFGIDKATIDLFCLSCRVLGRKIEYNIMEYINKLNTIINVKFIQTNKNEWLKEVFEQYHASILNENNM